MPDYEFDYNNLNMKDILEVFSAEAESTAAGLAANFRLMEKAGLDLSQVSISEMQVVHKQFWTGIKFYFNPARSIFGKTE